MSLCKEIGISSHTIGPVSCGQIWFQKAVMGEPAATVAVSWSAPEVPSSLQAMVGSVASWIGLLYTSHVNTNTGVCMRDTY